MIVKYKVTDFAKDTGLPVRKILDTLDGHRRQG